MAQDLLLLRLLFGLLLLLGLLGLLRRLLFILIHDLHDFLLGLPIVMLDVLDEGRVHTLLLEFLHLILLILLIVDQGIFGLFLLLCSLEYILLLALDVADSLLGGCL